MPSVTATETQASLLEAVRALPTEGQRAVLSFAKFLQHQENERRVETGEAEWDRHFSQPHKMARFAEWARQSLVEHPAESFDGSKL